MKITSLFKNTKLTVSVEVFPHQINFFHLLSTFFSQRSRPINSIDVLTSVSLAHMIHIDLLSGFAFPQCFPH